MVAVCALVKKARRRLVRGRAHRAHAHGLDAAAGDRGRGGAARAAARRRARSPRRPSRPPRAPSRPADLNASPDYKRHLARVLCRRALRRRRRSERRELRARRGRRRGPWPARATSPTGAWRRPSTSPPRSSSRCCSRARPAWARPRWRARWPRATGARADPPAVPRGHRPPPRGLRLGLPAPAAGDPRGRGGRARRASCSAASSCCAGRCWRRSSTTAPAVLLIDEIDRADDEFEAFLLEFLADFAITIPELGTVAARAPAARGADLQPHARAARRAQAPLPLPLDRLPDARARGRDRARAAARRARGGRRARVRARSRGCASEELYKLPGVGETITWARALLALDGDGRPRRHARRRAEGARGHRPRARAGVLRGA